MTKKPVSKNDDDMLAAEYVMGLLSLVERKALEKRLDGDVALKAQVLFWENKVSPLSDEIVPVAAPPQVLQGIEKHLFSDEKPGPKWWDSLALWRGLSFASLAGVAVLFGLSLQQPQSPSVTQEVMAEISAPGNDLKLVVLYDADNGLLKFNRLAGTPASGRDYELWLVAGNEVPVSLGVVPAANQGTMPLPAEYKDKLLGSVFAISDEPIGGSPTGKATGPVLATGTIHSI